MNDVEYCYWLMGVFELGEIKTINKKQLLLIREHLNLVENKKSKFCNWLEGFLQNEEIIEMNEKGTKIILDKLRNEFIETIDRNYDPKILDALYDAHNGVLDKKPKKEPKDEPPRLEALC